MFLELDLLPPPPPISLYIFVLCKCSWGFKRCVIENFPGSAGSIKPLLCSRSVCSCMVCWANTVLLSRRKHSLACICLSVSYPLCKYCALKTHSLRSVFILVMNHCRPGRGQKPFDAQEILAVGLRLRTKSFFIRWCLQSCLNNYILYWVDGVACIIKLFSLRLVKFQVFAIGAAVSSQAKPLLTCLQCLERPKHFVWGRKNACTHHYKSTGVL